MREEKGVWEAETHACDELQRPFCTRKVELQLEWNGVLEDHQTVFGLLLALVLSGERERVDRVDGMMVSSTGSLALIPSPNAAPSLNCHVSSSNNENGRRGMSCCDD